MASTSPSSNASITRTRRDAGVPDEQPCLPDQFRRCAVARPSSRTRAQRACSGLDARSAGPRTASRALTLSRLSSPFHRLDPRDDVPGSSRDAVAHASSVRAASWRPARRVPRAGAAGPSSPSSPPRLLHRLAEPSVAPSGPPDHPARPARRRLPPAAFDPRPSGCTLEPVVDGFVVAAGGHPRRRRQRPHLRRRAGGRIRIVRDGQLRRAIRSSTSATGLTAGGERGLLGLAFHPDFPTDPRFFVNYTDLDGDTVVASFTARGRRPDRADADSEVVLLRIDQPYPNHNGGALAFGPGRLPLHRDRRRRLGRRPARQRPAARHAARQDPADRRRRQRRRRRAYAIPADNPFVDQAGALPEIWHLGLRNPWRISFDRETGDLWIGDVGQGELGGDRRRPRRQRRAELRLEPDRGLRLLRQATPAMTRRTRRR